MLRKKKLALGCLTLLVGPPFLLFLIVIFTAIFVNGYVGIETEYSQSKALKNPPPPLKESIDLKIITYNIADAYLFTFNRPERLKAIAEELIRLDPDIVGFQESFIEKDRELFFKWLEPSRLKHHVYYASGTLGSGVLIASAFPISEAYFHRFEHSNPWYKIFEGDWWAGKGVGLARIELPDHKGYIDFYNTHAQAGRGNPSYIYIRRDQFITMADFINRSRCDTAPAFVVGDMNTPREAMDYKLLMEKARLSRQMKIDSYIDHIYSVDDARYRYEVLDTVEIKGRTQGHESKVFLAALPSWEQLKKMLWGPPEETSWSDHSGYMSTIRITPLKQQEGEAPHRTEN